MTFTDAARALLPGLQAIRRDLHAAPEIGLDLPNTQARVLAELEPLGLDVMTGTTSTSVVAVLRGGRPGPAVLLRGDMDALPVVERTGLPYASTNGAMHACGHDLHTASLIGAARLLAERRAELPGSVVFMFQPGEEGLGGAKHMIDEGVLDAAGERVAAAYGVHVFTGPDGPHGRFMTRPGPLMASGNKLYLTVHGRGGHGSQAWTAVDPVACLLEIGQALHVMVTRRFSPEDPVVLSVTQLWGSDAVNIIPASAKLGATVRTLSVANVEKVRDECRRVAEGIAAAHGCTVDFEWDAYYPATINDDAEARFVLDTLAEVFGADRVDELAFPEMGSEDFSFVLSEVPGAYFFLGATPPTMDAATAPVNHSPLVDFDDGLLADSAAALAEVAWRRLHRDAE